MNTYQSSLLFAYVGMFLMLQCFQMFESEEKGRCRLLVLIKLLLTAGVITLYPFPVFAFISFFAFYPKVAADYGKPRRTAVQFLSASLLLLLCVYRTDVKYSARIVLFLLLLLLVMSLMDIFLTKLFEKNRQLKNQMEQTAVSELHVRCLNEKLSIQSQVADRNARLEERENIARNIHNVVGHTITSAIVSLQAYEVMKEAKPDAASEKLTATNERMHLALEEIRRVVRVMDAETDEISMNDFCKLLGNELDKFSMDTEIKIFHNFTEFMKEQQEERLQKRTYEFLHSVLAESLNNGIRHGQATEFYIFLKADKAHIQLTVSDNGTGFQKLPEKEQKQRLLNGFGLRKIREFVEKSGGSMQVENEIGFCVRVTLKRTEGQPQKGKV